MSEREELIEALSLCESALCQQGLQATYPDIIAKARAALSAWMRDLKPDWDSYGARRISEDAIAIASEIHAALMSKWQIVPVATGGVQIELHAAGIDIEIEINPDCTVEVFAEPSAAPADLDALPDEPVFIGHDIFYKGENYGTDRADAFVDYAADLRAHCQQNSEARKAAEAQASRDRGALILAADASNRWQKRAESAEAELEKQISIVRVHEGRIAEAENLAVTAEARARELEKRISGYEQEADRMTLLNVKLMHQPHALQSEQTDERKEA